MPVEAIVLMRGRVEAQGAASTLCDIEEGRQVQRTVPVQVFSWPALPEEAYPQPLAANPRNPGEALWLVTFPQLTPDFLAFVTHRDVRDLMALYAQWTGVAAPEDWQGLIGLELAL